MRYFFIVSAVEVKKGPGNGDSPVEVEVGKAPGLKCERCWNFSIHVGEDKNYPTVCERCSAVLKEIGGEIGGGDRGFRKRVSYRQEPVVKVREDYTSGTFEELSSRTK